MASKKTKEKEDKNSKETTVEFIKNKNVHFIVGFIFLLIGIYLFISFLSYFFTGEADQSRVENLTVTQLSEIENEITNWAGSMGAFLSYYFIEQGIGIAAFVIAAYITLVGLKLMKLRRFAWLKFFFVSVVLIFIISAFFGFLYSLGFYESFFCWGGKHGFYIAQYMQSNLGTIGTLLSLFAAMILLLIALNSKTIAAIQRFFTFDFLKRKKKLPSEETNDTAETKESEITSEPELEIVPIFEEELPTQPIELDLSGSVAANEIIDTKKEKSKDEIQFNSPEEELKMEVNISHPDDEVFVGDTQGDFDPTLELSSYKYPTTNLLNKYDAAERQINMTEQNANKQRIIETLGFYGIRITSIKATPGPTITLYEIVPEAGVRISKIRNLEDDIALSLAALGIRIIAPIPGKGTIGIEVPNKDPQIVSMQSIIASKKFQENKFDLPFAIGKTITNEIFMADLCKMPHLLVAGATGQGKSVGLNAIITSLLYKKHPAQLKFVLIDPKKVEFNIYSKIEKHFLAKLPDEEEAIITDVTKVVQTLNSLCIEMDTRYDLLKKAGTRNIKEYNAKFISRRLNPKNGHRYMPYIVVVIDEFGDLIMTAGKEVELPIARIAQLARAIGIHMIIATQRPSTNIITGTIKANFPARVAFRVSSMIDSRTILDCPGANQLIGRGDMLFSQGGDLVRVQCAFVDTPEVEEVCEFIGAQRGYSSAYQLPEYTADNNNSLSEVDLRDRDPMFEDAARLIVANQQGSTSLIQRKFAIGYNRAGRLMDQLESAGIVGPFEGSKARQILVVDEVHLENILQSLR